MKDVNSLAIFFLLFFFFDVSLNISFKFKQEIFVENQQGVEISDAEIEFTINTKEMIMRQKMFSGCSDVHFESQSNNQTLYYWIEKGCGASITTFWILLPTLRPEGETIIFSYGNDEYFSENAIMYRGEMLLLKDSICNGEWENYSEDCENKLIKATPAFEIFDEGSHRHKLSGENENKKFETGTEINGHEFKTSYSGGSKFYTDLTTNKHTHISAKKMFKYQSTDENHFPPSLKLALCSDINPLIIPKDAIVILNSKEIAKNVEDWEIYEEINDKFILLSYQEEEIGKIGGGEEHDHSWKINLKVEDMYDDSNGYTGSSGDYAVSVEHKHSITGVSGKAKTPIAAHTKVLFAKSIKDNNSLQPGMIIPFSFKPPLGYDPFTFSTKNGYLKGTIKEEENFAKVEQTKYNHTHPDISGWTLHETTKKKLLMKVDDVQTVVSRSHLHEITVQETGVGEGYIINGDIIEHAHVGLQFFKRKESPNLIIGEEEASILECFNLEPNNENVCNSRGKCVKFNKCECTDSFYGIECDERISKIGDFGNTNQFKVPYVISHSLIETLVDEESTTFDCTMILQDYSTFENKEEIICKWEMDLFSTNYLVVSLPPNLKMSKINLKSITGIEEVIEVSLNPYLFVLSADLVLGILIPFLIILVIVLFIAVLVVGIIFWRKFYSKKTELQKFNKLENVEMLIQEKVMEKDNPLLAVVSVDKKMFEVKFSELIIQEQIKEENLQKKKKNYKSYKVKWNSKDFYFKSFNFKSLKEKEFALFEGKFKEQVSILSGTKNQFSPRFFGAVVDEAYGVLYEYCAKGNIKNFLRTYKKEEGKEYPLENKIKMIADIAMGTRNLHSKKIIHSTLNYHNIMITKNNAIKIKNFEEYPTKEEKMENLMKIMRSAIVPPEVISVIIEKSDVFNFGWLIYQIITEDWLDERYQKAEFEKIWSDPEFRPNLKEKKIPLYLKNLISQCWSFYSSQRPSFVEIGKIIKEKKATQIKFISKTEQLSSLNNQLSGLKGRYKGIFDKQLREIKRLEGKLGMNIHQSQALKKVKKEIDSLGVM